MLLTSEEVATVFRVHSVTVRRLVDRGELEAVRIDKRNLRFNSEKVAAFSGLSHRQVMDIVNKKKTYTNTVDHTWLNTGIWTDDKFNSLDDKGKSAFIFMMSFATGQDTGVFEFYSEEIREKMWWVDWDDFLIGVFDMESKGLVDFDRDGYVVLFPDISKYRSISTPSDSAEMLEG